MNVLNFFIFILMEKDLEIKKFQKLQNSLNFDIEIDLKKIILFQFYIYLGNIN